MAYNQQLSVFSQFSPNTTGTAGQVHVSGGNSAPSYWAATIPVSAYSGQFNGSSQYFSVGTTSDFKYLHDATSDWTVECWVYPTTLNAATSQHIIATDAETAFIGTFICLSNYANGDIAIATFKGTPGTLTGYNTATNTVVVNTWQHIAVTFTASTKAYAIYVNGVSKSLSLTPGATAPGSFAYSTANHTYPLNVGRYVTGSASGGYFPGYISNLRIVKSVVYTGAFTPPTSPLGTAQGSGTNIAAVSASQTSLLTCNGPGFTDSSPNAFVVTNAGNVVSSQFAPFSSFSAIARSATQTQTVLTSGSGTYYTPSGVAWLRVRMVGGGGGGSGSNAGNWGGSGGGSGAFLEAYVPNPAASYAYSIGAGGGGGAAVSSGSAGANTTFGSLNCGGGLAGLYGSFNTGTAPTASGGQLNVSGIAGGGASYGTAQAIGGVSGAPSQFSAGGAGSNPSGSTNPGLAGAYGSGGGGAGQTPSGSSGGAGGSGLIIVEENYAVNVTSGNYTASYLVVAGGGSGGFDSAGNGGGGGGGGLLTNSTLLSVGTTYTIIVGAGAATAPSATVGNNGSNSSAFGSTAVGGGGGGTYLGISGTSPGASGGSGGGGGQTSSSGGAGTSGQGNVGGNSGGIGGGGGGGAGAAGSVSYSTSGREGGYGGAGLNWQSLGTFYSGGGAGSSHNTATAGVPQGGAGGGGNGHYGATVAVAGTANRGGGGGGGGENVSAGAGGSGVVVISYVGSTRGSGGTITSSGGYTYHTFTTSGIYTA